MKQVAKSMDEYILSFPEPTQGLLREMRAAIREAAPEAQEIISYQMPTFYLNGNLVHFAGYAKHIGFYPTSSGIRNFQKELESYKTSKGTVQFPLDQPLPIDLIQSITKFRVEENLKKEKGG